MPSVTNKFYNCQVTQYYTGKDGHAHVLDEETEQPKSWTKWTREEADILKIEASKQEGNLDFDKLSRAVSVALSRPVTADSCRSKMYRLGLGDKSDEENSDNESDEEEIGNGGQNEKKVKRKPRIRRDSIEEKVRLQEPRTRQEIKDFEKTHGYSPVGPRDSEYLLKKANYKK